MLKKVSFIILIYLIIFSLNIEAANKMKLSPNEQWKAVLTTTEAYRRKGADVQYDSYKKNLNATPEDATSTHPIYTVCSGLVYMSYKQALDIKNPVLEVLESTGNMMEYAKANCTNTKSAVKNNSLKVVFYFNNDIDENGNPVAYYNGARANDTIANNMQRYCKGEITGEESVEKFKQAFVEKLINAGIQPGDIFVYSNKDKKGHTMIVREVTDGSVLLLEAGGGDDEGRYNLSDRCDVIEENGAITGVDKDYIDLKDRIYTEKIEMCVLRVIPDEGKTSYEISDAAKMRINSPKINISKTVVEVTDKDGVSTKNQTYVTPRSKIKIQLVISNDTQDESYKGLNGKEIIPLGLTISEAKGQKVKDCRIIHKMTGVDLSINGNNIEWNIDSLNPAESLAIEYTVYVPDATAIKKELNFTGTVSDSVGTIKTSNIEMLVGKGLTKTEKEKLLLAFNYIYMYSAEDIYDKINSVKSVEIREDTVSAIKTELIEKLERKGIVKEVRATIQNDIINHKYLNSRSFINILYKAIFGIDLKLDNLSNSEIITYDSNLGKADVKYTKVERSISASNYIYSNFYGLRLVKDENTAYANSKERVKASLAWKDLPTSELKDRARTLNINMLEDGDVILRYAKVNDDWVNYGYIYLDNILYRYRSADNETEFTFEKIKGKSLDKFLNDLMGDNYIILRPYTT